VAQVCVKGKLKARCGYEHTARVEVAAIRALVESFASAIQLFKA
jgi:hypothetical protein